MQEAGEKQIFENMGWEIEHSSFKTKITWIIHWHCMTDNFNPVTQKWCSKSCS